MAGSGPPREVTLKPKAPPPTLLQAGMVARQVLPVNNRRVTLFEDKITVRDTNGESEALPRRYTLTHDDGTAALFLSIGAEFDPEALSQPHTREKRDDVLAELVDRNEPRLIVSCLVDGDELAGQPVHPGLRRRIFEKEMPFALAVLLYGDRFFFERHPELDQAPVTVDFRSTDSRYAGRKEYGRVTDYRVTGIAGESRRLAFIAAALAALGMGALFLAKRRNQ